MTPVFAIVLGLIATAGLVFQTFLWAQWHQAANWSVNPRWTNYRRRLLRKRAFALADDITEYWAGLWSGWWQPSDKRASSGMGSLATGMLAPTVFGAVVALAVVAYAGFSWGDAKKPNFDFVVFLYFVAKALVFLLIVVIKAFFGILVATYVLCSEAYFYMEYGRFQPVPILSELLNWVFSFAPTWASTVWLSGQVAFAVLSGAAVAEASP